MKVPFDMAVEAGALGAAGTDLPLITHICGNITGHLPQLASAGFRGVSFDAKTDIQAARTHLTEATGQKPVPKIWNPACTIISVSRIGPSTTTPRQPLFRATRVMNSPQAAQPFSF